ncbi:MAG: hypothetical protein P4L33_08915 [Capsulimonadaceae bacterium]|nr:hypothetical protein [Capsulimonadaceae bacterium]
MNMRIFALPCAAFVLAAGISPVSADGVAAVTPLSRAERLNFIAVGLQNQADRLLKKIEAPNATPTDRDLPWAALAELSLRRDPKRAEELLKCAFDPQIMDPASPAYGKLPWQIGHPEIKDDNAIEFGTQAIGPILLGYRDKLSPEIMTYLRPHVDAAFVALDRHKVRVSYTNIFLMKLTSLILMGQAAGNETAVDEGRKMLGEWFDYTRTAGIHEYGSPTYYATSLNSLVLGYKYAPDADTREKYRAALDLFWSDMAANYFAPRGTLSGPHSRDYSFLSGEGGIGIFLYAEGLKPAINPRDVDLEKATAYEGLIGNCYRPSAKILALANVPERTVIARYDATPGCDRYNFITPDYAIGSASKDYGEQDKLIDIELASPTIINAITIDQDAFDSPYGTVKTADRSGHDKPTHLQTHPATAQCRNTILTLLDAGQKKPITTTSLATNVVFPIKVDEIRFEGASVTITSPFEQAGKVGSILTLRVGNAALCVRVFAATGVGGSAPVIVLKADEEGLKRGVARLAVYEYRGESATLAPEHLPVGLLIEASHVDSSSDLRTLEDAVSGARITQIAPDKTGAGGYSAQIASHALDVRRPISADDTPIRRTDGVDMSAPVLSVNGEDIATPILNAAGH